MTYSLQKKKSDYFSYCRFVLIGNVITAKCITVYPKYNKRIII